MSAFTPGSRFAMVSAALAVLLVTGLVFMRRGGPAGAAPGAGAEIATGRAAPSLELLPDAARGEAKRADPTAVRTRIEAPRAAGETAPAWLITARAVDEAGRPLDGIPMVVEHWEDGERGDSRTQRSDSGGVFALAWPAAIGRVLHVSIGGERFAATRWWLDPAPECTALGDVRLTFGGRIAGAMLSPDGSPVRAALEVRASSDWRPSAVGASSWSRTVESDRNDGTYRIEAVPPGRVALVGPAGTRAVQVRSGGTTNADWIIADADIERRILVEAIEGPFIPLCLIEPGQLWVEAPDGARIACVPERYGHWSAEGVGPGPHAVVLDCPALQSRRIEGVLGGERVELDLVGSAALVVRLEDSTGRERREGLNWSLAGASERSDGKFRGSVSEGLPGEALRGGGVRFSGMAPGRYRILAREGDRTVASLDDFEVVAGEEREALLQRAATGDIVGRVVSSAGEPLGGLWVACRDAGAQLCPRARSGTDGTFRLSACPVGLHRIAANGAYSGSSTTVEVELTEGETADVELVMPAGGRLCGRVVLHGRAAPERYCLKLLRNEEARDAEELRRAVQTGPYVELDGEGRFRSPVLYDRTGQVALVARPADPSLPSGAQHSSFIQFLDLGEFEIDPGRDTEREFDLRGVLPAELWLRVVLDGRAAADLNVRLVDPNPEGNREQRYGRARLDDAGAAILQLLPPGDYRLVLAGQHGATDWAWAAPRGLHIRPAGWNELVLELELFAGAVRLTSELSEFSDQLERHAWCVGPEFVDPHDIDGFAGSYRADPDGRLPLRLPAGSYRLYADRSPLRSEPFDWGPGTTDLIVAIEDPSSEEL